MFGRTSLGVKFWLTYFTQTIKYTSKHTPNTLAPSTNSNNFASYGNGAGGTDYLEEAHKALAPGLAAYKEIVDMLGLK